jgi:hypothetical protein
MQTRISLLLLLASSLYAAAQTAPVPCPSGSSYNCTILLTYDAGGNRTAWQEVCTCATAQRLHARMAETPAATTAASAPLTIAKLYPNPTAGSVRIELNAAAPDGTLLFIIDAFGRVIAEQPLSGDNAEINLRNYPSGVYQFVVQGSVQRVVKL